MGLGLGRGWALAVGSCLGLGLRLGIGLGLGLGFELGLGLGFEQELVLVPGIKACAGPVLGFECAIGVEVTRATANQIKASLFKAACFEYNSCIVCRLQVLHTIYITALA